MPRRFFAWRWGYRGGSDMDLAPDVMDLAAKLTGNRTSRRFLPPNRPCRLASHSARDHDPLRRRRVRRGLNVQSLGERSHFAERFGAAIAHTERPEVNRRSETSGSKAARDLRR